MLSRFLSLWDKVESYVTLGLLVALLAVTVMWRLSASGLVAEKAGRAGDRAKFEAAQASAENLALKRKQEQEKIDREKQEAADATATALRGKYDGILRKYAEAQRTISRTNLSRSRSSSEGSNRPSTNSELPDSTDTLEIPYKDAEICAENTARLEAVHKWATSR